MSIAGSTACGGEVTPWADNTRTSSHPIGDKLNLADLTVFAVTSAIKKGQWDFIDGAVLDPYPGLVKHHDLVLVHPAVTEHAIYM